MLEIAFQMPRNSKFPGKPCPRTPQKFLAPSALVFTTPFLKSWIPPGDDRISWDEESLATVVLLGVP